MFLFNLMNHCILHRDYTNIIIKFLSLPDILRLSQTCRDARYLFPEIFNLGLKLEFCKENGHLYVSCIDKIFNASVPVFFKYRHYFPYGGYANGIGYYLKDTNKDPDLFDIIEAAKNDDVEYIKNSNYKEYIDFEAGDIGYYNHYRGYEEEWSSSRWHPCSIWNIFWWFGGPNVKEYLKVYSDPDVQGPYYTDDGDENDNSEDNS